VEYFEVFTIDAVTGAGSTAFLTLIIAYITRASLLICKMIFGTFFFALLASLVSRTLDTDVFVESETGAFFTAWMTLTTH
jgi:hypothetical protein